MGGLVQASQASIGSSAVRRRAGRALGALLLGGLAAGLGSCAKPVVSDLDAYQVVPMNQVVPYPSEEERAKRVFTSVVSERPSEGLDEAELAKARAQVRIGLEKIAASYGSAVLERTNPQAFALRSDRPAADFGGVPVETAPSGDYAITARFTTFEHTARYSAPTKLPWQTDDDVKGKPGSCLHAVQVAFDVNVVEKSWEDLVQKTYVLSHEAKQENDDLDQACTIAPVNVDTLFETAIAEALSCLDLPLGTRVSPRGHVLAHRKAKEGESHIYQVSLGADQGVDAQEPLEIRRSELSQGPDGQQVRTDRVIATGAATDQITAQDAWIAVNPDDVKSEILEGDLVLRVFTKGLINNLTGPNCKRILVER